MSIKTLELYIMIGIGTVSVIINSMSVFSYFTGKYKKAIYELLLGLYLVSII